MLSNHTLKCLHALRTVQWFSNCGQPFEPKWNVASVSTWTDALRIALEDRDMKDQRHEDTNIIRDQVRGYPSEWRRWNSITEAALPILESATADFSNWPLPSDRLKDEERLKNMVEWDLIHYAIELEYSALITTRRFTIKGEIYLLGHLPCGWLPGNKVEQLIVF